jgi:cystathionine gamma-lyase
MAAISTTLMTFLSSGDHIVASTDVYGGTYGLLTEELPRFGIEVSMADMTDTASYEAAIQPNTKILYIETLTNPVLKVCDIEAMAAIAKKHNILCIVDNTFTSPWGCQPLSLGADIVLHSTTKYLGGHSDIIGGAVVSSRENIEKIFHRKVHFGGCADPHNCYLLERGMRTLHVRMPQICSSAAELAIRLENHPMIEKVNHPSLKSYSGYEIAQRIMPKGTGMIGFVVKGGDAAALAFMRGLTMIYEATSLGGVESLVECPFNSSHMVIPEDVRHAAGLLPGYVRISIGIEDLEDLWTDIERGFANVK